MPQPSTQKKKKKGRQPAHQNTFAFMHNPKSKLTAKILASPNKGLCQRCHDKIEWRKQYRKYKPLSQPARCNICKRRNITAAYHTICDDCARSKAAWRKMNLALGREDTGENENTKNEKVCAMCVKAVAKLDDEDGDTEIETQIAQQIQIMEQKLKRPLKLRESKGIERKIYRAHEKEKEMAKLERRRLRDEAAGKVQACGEHGCDGGGEEQGESECESEANCDDEKGQAQNEGDHEFDLTDENDDNFDPFLQAIGGKDKLLTGEAYQKMMLEKERLEKV